MSNWQEWAVALLLLLCLIRIGMSVRSLFSRSKEKRGCCSCCSSGCDRKHSHEETTCECGKEEKIEKKKCCG